MDYYVYILANGKNGALYIGVTDNLVKRIYQHKNKAVSSFSSKYNLNKLVYYEIYENVNQAIAREKQIKAGNRNRKINLVEKFNPNWEDLYATLV